MDTVILNTKKIEAFREILNTDDENILIDTIETKRPVSRQIQISPPEGFITGDEFERRVKERVTKFYKENGLL